MKNKKTINIMNQQVYNFLKAEAQSDRAKALASLHLLTNHPDTQGIYMKITFLHR